MAEVIAADEMGVGSITMVVGPNFYHSSDVSNVSDILRANPVPIVLGKFRSSMLSADTDGELLVDHKYATTSTCSF